MIESKISLELRNKIIEIAGREKGKEIINLIMKYGVEIITAMSEVKVRLPSIEIESINSYTGEPGPVQNRFDAVRKHQFICKINGSQLPILQSIELDPFDYGEADLLRARLTIIPMANEDLLHPIDSKGIFQKEKDNA
jgi:hypothetical protein